jgi:hypothetical protein
LFEPLPGDNGRSLAHLLGELRKSAQIASKFEKMAEKAGGSVTTAADSTDAAAHASKRSRVTGVPVVDQHPKTIVAHIVSQNKCSLYLVRLPAVRARQLRLLTLSLRVLCLFFAFCFQLDMCDAVDKKLALYRSQTSAAMDVSGGSGSAAAAASSSPAASASSSPAAASAAGGSSSSSSSSSSLTVPDYVAIMSPLRFGEVENFKSHHYTKTYGATSAALSRAWVKRLGTEYSDLSKALPINEGSSVFLRYKEDAMAFCQFLIAAPDETPYGYGCFLFDAFFPNTYPSGPPLVNLQTTGNGSSVSIADAKRQTEAWPCSTLCSLVGSCFPVAFSVCASIPIYTIAGRCV